eukprot:763526-Hanusia_phi.AAC.1
MPQGLCVYSATKHFVEAWAQVRCLLLLSFLTPPPGAAARASLLRHQGPPHSAPPPPGRLLSPLLRSPTCSLETSRRSC